MASTYSDRLRIELIGTGEQSGTWGNTTNTNLGTLIEEAIAGVASITMSDANYTLTTANGATDESRQAVLVMSGSLSTTRDVICPAEEKVYIIKNSTTGGQSIVLKTSGGTGVTIPNGKTMLVFCDGTNVLTGSDALTSISTAGNATISGTLTVDGATSLDDSVVINESGADKDFRVEGDTDQNLLFTDASTDRVGVGTSTPDAKLTVNGVGAFGAGAVSTPSIAATGDLNTGMWFPAADTVAVSTGGSERVRIDTSGNVGIGTSSPNVTGVGTNSTAVTIRGTSTNGRGVLELVSNGTTADGNSIGNIYFYDNTNLNASIIAARASSTTTGNLLFLTNGGSGNTERVRIDSSGNVGIGTSSPGARLEVAGNQINSGTNPYIGLSSAVGTTPSYIQYLNSENSLSLVCAGGANTGFIKFSTGNGSERMRIDSSGNVGIGASPSYSLDVYRSSSTTASIVARNATSTAAFYSTSSASFAGTTTNTDFGFLTNNAERARIDTAGNVTIGTTSNTEAARLFVRYPYASSGGTAPIGTEVDTTLNVRALAFRNPNGLVGTISTSGSATAYNTSSDYRLKENVEPMQNALAKVALLNPVTYTWKADGSDGQGFIAHELQAVCPDAVTGEKDAVDNEGKPIYQGVDTSFLVATLTKAIQELKAELDAVKAELSTLKGS